MLMKSERKLSPIQGEILVDTIPKFANGRFLWAILTMPPPWMPFLWCGVRIAFITIRNWDMGLDNAAKATLCRTQTISVPTEKGDRENED